MAEYKTKGASQRTVEWQPAWDRIFSGQPFSYDGLDDDEIAACTTALPQPRRRRPSDEEIYPDRAERIKQLPPGHSLKPAWELRCSPDGFAVWMPVEAVRRSRMRQFLRHTTTGEVPDFHDPRVKG